MTNSAPSILREIDKRLNTILHDLIMDMERAKSRYEGYPTKEDYDTIASIFDRYRNEARQALAKALIEAMPNPYKNSQTRYKRGTINWEEYTRCMAYNTALLDVKTILEELL